MVRIGMAILLASVIPFTVVAEPAGQDTVLEIENAWVRALPPGQPNTAAYLTLVNRGEVAVIVESASADVADKAEMHAVRSVDGLMRMEQLQSLEVAPGERLELAPGGTHLMLLGLETMPVSGDEVQLCLQLAPQREICALADVRKSRDSSDAQNHQHPQHDH
jgi:copper(I)-binding protein